MMSTNNKYSIVEAFKTDELKMIASAGAERPPDENNRFHKHLCNCEYDAVVVMCWEYYTYVRHYNIIRYNDGIHAAVMMFKRWRLTLDPPLLNYSS